MGDAAAPVLGPLRTLVSVAFLAVLVWAAFTVRLGDRTFADHMDRIGETEEARALLDGARGRVRPALEEVKQRLMGEYVEAPTYVPATTVTPRPPAVMTVRTGEAVVPAATRKAAAPARQPTRAAEVEAADAGKLPGRRAAR